MQLPDSRPFGTKGRKATQDFLSLYSSHSTAHQQDPRPPSQGNFPKTHDFLGEASANEESKNEMSAVRKQPPEGSAHMEHILPGGIGTYSISQAMYFSQRVPKPEGTMFSTAQGSSSDRNDENSNCSSYTGSAFTFPEEPAVKKGKTGKENTVTAARSGRRESAPVKLGQWKPERPSHSSSNNNNHRNGFNSFSSSQPSAQRSQSVIEMIKSAKGSTVEEETDDGEEFAPKKESPVSVTPVKGELKVKVDGKSHDQRPNTPRSKHSATEQRRRSKINDRFQKLREIIPHGDQKRDKASFLLEVIEYIQFLQEKVQKYEGSYQGWNLESAKLMPWRNAQRPPESFINQPHGVISGSNPAIVFGANLDEKNGVSVAIPGHAHNTGVSTINPATTYKLNDHQSGPTNKAVSFPTSLQPHMFTPVGSGEIAQLSPRLISDAADNIKSQTQVHTRSSIIENSDATDKLKEQDLAIEGGTISISSVYSQRLLNTLTKALQNSGVDLSQARISVQVQLGTMANGRLNAPTLNSKDKELPSRNKGTTHSRDASCDEYDQVGKKLKTGKD